MKDRKEQFAGTQDECRDWIASQDPKRAFDVEPNDGPGPAFSVFYQRKPVDRTIRSTISRETRETFRVQGVTGNRNRPLIVSFKAGDLIEFRPKGTRQAVTIPLASAYAHARFCAARAAATAKRQAKAARKAGK